MDILGEGLETEHSDREIVRYYEVDFSKEKFPQRQKSLYDFKEITKGLSVDELLKLKEQIEKDLFNKIGS